MRGPLERVLVIRGRQEEGGGLSRRTRSSGEVSPGLLLPILTSLTMDGSSPQ